MAEHKPRMVRRGLISGAAMRGQGKARIALAAKV